MSARNKSVGWRPDGNEPAAREAFAGRREIRALTGLRGVAAVVVLAFHYRYFSVHDPMKLGVLGPGYLMVDLFFVLSGFVMALTYADGFRAGRLGRAHARFLWARFARLYPLYFVTTMIALVLPMLTMYQAPDPTVPTVLSNLALVQTMGAGLVCGPCGQSLNYVTWSLSTETGAYLLFPLLLIAVWRGPAWRAVACVALCFATLVLMAVLPREWFHRSLHHHPLNTSGGDTLWPLARCVAEFTIGLATQRLSRRRPVASVQRGWPADLAIAAALLAAWLIPDADLLIVALYPLLILQVCDDRSPLARLLGAPGFHHLGQWSYALYLIHLPMLAFEPVAIAALAGMGVADPIGSAMVLLAFMSVGAAAAAHALLERPLRGVLRRFPGPAHTSAYE